MTEFAPDYGAKSDDELLRLALDPDSLTPQAALTLSAELKNRKLNSPDRLSAFSQKEKQHRHQDEIHLGKVGSLIEEMAGVHTGDST